MVQGQQRACMPVYIGKSGELFGCYQCLTHSHITHRQTTEYRATQLVYSIKLKLSHATTNKSNTKKTYVFKRHGSRAHFANCFWRIQLRSLCITMNVVWLFWYAMCFPTDSPWGLDKCADDHVDHVHTTIGSNKPVEI